MQTLFESHQEPVMETAMKCCETEDVSRDKLMTDVKTVVADADAFLRASIGQKDRAYTEARKKLEETLDTAKAQVAEGHRAMTERVRAAVQATDTYVHENPWGPIAMGASVGLLLGWLVARR
jgi:ElaB/YqjD/DUF883 family membrane-anchored ribosome-binding protein